MKKILYTLAFAIAFAPSVVSASEHGGGLTIEGIFFWLQDVINLAVPVLIAAAVLVFLWGVLKYILKAGDADARKEAQGTMIWGIIGIFLMVSVWGLVNVLVNTFGLTSAPPEQNIEDLVNLPLGDFGQDLEGTQVCSDPGEVRHVNGPKHNDCEDDCASGYQDRGRYCLYNR